MTKILDIAKSKIREGSSETSALQFIKNEFKLRDDVVRGAKSLLRSY